MPWKLHYSAPLAVPYASQRLNDITISGLQVLDARDNLIGLAKVRFDNQLMKTNKALLDFAG